MTEPTTPDERAEIVRLRRQATPGEWTACRMTHAERGGNLSPKELGEYVENSVIKSLAESGSLQFLFVSVDKEDGPADVCHVGNGPMSPANAAYIVAACNAADRLVVDVERLERENEQFRKDRADGLYGVERVAKLIKTYEGIQDRAEAAERQRDALREALKKFGRHAACASGHAWTWSEADLELCDCGLAAALKETAR